MQLKIMAFIISSAFALEACGQQESMPGAGALPCNAGVCKAEVTVANNDCSNAANIKVSPDPLPVPKGNPNNIEWTVQDGFTWVAPPGGITSLPTRHLHGSPGHGQREKVQTARRQPRDRWPRRTSMTSTCRRMAWLAPSRIRRSATGRSGSSGGAGEPAPHIRERVGVGNEPTFADRRREPPRRDSPARRRCAARGKPRPRGRGACR